MSVRGLLARIGFRQRGYEVFSVYEQARGIPDDEIIAKANSEKWILITNDKDFEEKIFRYKQSHEGVILLRLDDERAKNKIDSLQKLLENHSDKVETNFIVVTENRVRIAQK
jgi:predicted nuclease of predicted toxin-antitoxin system